MFVQKQGGGRDPAEVNEMTSDLDELNRTLFLNSCHRKRRMLRDLEELDLRPMRRATFIRNFWSSFSQSYPKVITQAKYINSEFREGLKPRGHG